MRWLRPLGHAVVLAAGLVVTSHAPQAKTRVGYAEGFSPAVESSVGAQKTTRSQRIRVRALGQELSLQLEENSSLASSIPAQARSRMSDLAILRGSIAGREGSWVRLTLVNGRYEGAIWDGSELYGVEPRDSLVADQYVAGATSAKSVIYRASDVVNEGPMKCGTGNEQIAGNALQQYKAVVSELWESSALLATRDIEVAIVGDYEFNGIYGANALATMISRMNVVDGIFASQLDVNIIPTDFTVFTSPDDPFTTAEASGLLEEFASYRNSTPVIRERGLAHLVTGRDLSGSTIGVGYVGALCEPFAGASVSMSNPGSSVSAALIIAHEIGHNFGAKHDGEAGHACSTTPQSFLMSPQANGSSTFSSCSVQTMQSFAASAACITPARTRDIAVSVPASPVMAIVGQSFNYVVDVASIGQGDAHNIITSVTIPGGFQVLSSSMPDAACSMSFGTVNCQLPTLAAGEMRRLTLSMRAPSQSGTYATSASITASSDRDSANNVVAVPIQVNRLLSASVAFTPATTSVVARAPVALTADVTSVGAQSLVDAVARLTSYYAQLTNVAVDGASCTENGSDWDCPLQTLAPGQSRRVTMQATTSQVGTTNVSLSVLAGAAPQAVVGSGSASINVTPQYDLEIATQTSRAIVAIGDVTEIPVTITSRGAETVVGAALTIQGFPGVALDLVAPGVTCAAVGNELQCNLGNMAPGAAINGRLRASASAAIRTYVHFDVPVSVPDDDSSNDHVMVLLEVRPGVDVGVTSDSWPYTQYDSVRVDRRLTITSFSAATTLTDVRATITLPASFAVHAASMGGGTCTVTGSTIACQQASTTETSLSVSFGYTPSEPGDYTGSIEVTAAGDSVPTNNSAQLLFNVLPNVDAEIEAPASAVGFINEPLDVEVAVVTNRYAMGASRFDVDALTGVTIESVRSSAGTCSQTSASRFSCQLGALAPDTTTPVIIRVRSASEVRSYLFASFIASDDVDGSNDARPIPIEFVPRGDARLTMPTTQSIPVIGLRYALDNIEVLAVARAKDVFVELFFDGTRVTGPVISGIPCDWSLAPPRCELPDLATGSSRRLRLEFTPTGAGPLPIRMRVGASNETNPADNEQTITLEVQSPPPPSSGSNGGGSGGSGGGGGGSMPAALLLVLLGLRLARARRATRRR